MEYRYKPTTNGRNAMAACLAMEKPPKITRVAFGSGKVDEGVNLADVHELLAYVADGAVGERRHENDRVYFTIQYANVRNKDIKSFILSEFIVYMEDPENGGDTDLLYGTLGDYRQPVPAYNPALPPSVFNFPLVMILSDELEVTFSAPAGLVTHDDLMAVVEHTAVLYKEITIPAEGWRKDGAGAYPMRLELPMEVSEYMIPELTVLPESIAGANACGLAPFAQTVKDALRLWAEKAPQEDIRAGLALLRNASGVYIGGGSGSTDGGSAAVPATKDRLGCVKVGEGLRVTGDGTISVDMASDAEVEEMLGEVFGRKEEEV